MIIYNNVTNEKLELKEKRQQVSNENLYPSAEYAIDEANKWYKIIGLLKTYKKYFDSQICILSLFSLKLYMKAILMTKGYRNNDKIKSVLIEKN